MSETITYETVLELIKETNRLSSERLEKEMRESRKEFDKKIGKISNTLGSFVEGLVEPKLLELFQKRGI